MGREGAGPLPLVDVRGDLPGEEVREGLAEEAVLVGLDHRRNVAPASGRAPGAPAHLHCGTVTGDEARWEGPPAPADVVGASDGGGGHGDPRLAPQPQRPVGPPARPALRRPHPPGADPGVRVVVLTGARPGVLLGCGPGRAAGSWPRASARRRPGRPARRAGGHGRPPPAAHRPGQRPRAGRGHRPGRRRPTWRWPATSATFAFSEVTVGVAPAMIAVPALAVMDRRAFVR